METIASILEFWFGSAPDDPSTAERHEALWWSKDPDTDAGIRDRFEPFVIRAADGGLQDWAVTAPGRLALILLTDQFPRNIYRDTPRAFQFDPVARSLCLEGIESGADHELHPLERVFLYLPLEHSESLDDQERCVALFKELLAGAGPDAETIFAGFLDYAVRHRDVVRRFGRFPHRNRILGRTSTPDELEFLKQPGSSF